MFRQGIARSFLGFVSLCAVLSIGIISCGGDDGDNWIGTWAIATLDGQSYEQILKEDEGENASLVTNNWTFNDDGTMEAKMTVQISGEVSSLELIGTYTLSGFNYTLTLTATKGTGFFEIDTGDTEEDTGTWSRDGSTLTLNSEDGTIIVFQKK